MSVFLLQFCVTTNDISDLVEQFFIEQVSQNTCLYIVYVRNLHYLPPAQVQIISLTIMRRNSYFHLWSVKLWKQVKNKTSQNSCVISLSTLEPGILYSTLNQLLQNYFLNTNKLSNQGHLCNVSIIATFFIFLRQLGKIARTHQKNVFLCVVKGKINKQNFSKIILHINKLILLVLIGS